MDGWNNLLVSFWGPGFGLFPGVLLLLVPGVRVTLILHQGGPLESLKRQRCRYFQPLRWLPMPWRPQQRQRREYLNGDPIGWIQTRFKHCRGEGDDVVYLVVPRRPPGWTCFFFLVKKDRMNTVYTIYISIYFFLNKLFQMGGQQWYTGIDRHKIVDAGFFVDLMAFEGDPIHHFNQKVEECFRNQKMYWTTHQDT